MIVAQILDRQTCGQQILDQMCGGGIIFVAKRKGHRGSAGITQNRLGIAQLHAGSALGAQAGQRDPGKVSQRIMA